MRRTALLLAFALALPLTAAENFHWDWHNARELGARDRLNRLHLASEDRNALRKALDRQLNKGLGGFQDPEDVRVALIDLNGDGTKEVVAQPMGFHLCGATGNCSFWIFERRQGQYVVIVDSIAQTFTIQPTISHEYRDIVLTMHGSATESEVKLYRFDGERYRRTACYDANWSVEGPDGEYHDVKEPVITPAKC